VKHLRITTGCAAAWALLLASAFPTRLTGQVEAEPEPAQTLSRQLTCDANESADLVRQAASAEAGNDDSAASLYRRAWQACPQNTLLLVKSAEAFHRQHKYEEAAKTAREAVLQNPRDARALLVLANALLMAQHLAESRDAVEQALKLAPDNTGAQILLANIWYLVGDSARAEQVFLKLLDREPNNEDAAYMLGRIYYMQNRTDHAMGLFQRALKVNPKSYRAWDNLGLCYDAAGNPEKAINAFLQAIKIVEKDFPEYDWPYANLADLLLRRNEFQQAYQAATIAAKRNPYSARNFFLGGKALLKLERTGDALKWIERSTDLDPNYPDALYLLGQVYLKTGQRDKAKEALDRFRVAKENAPKQRR
jgi:tetratricopeptide (TPR) repeat protein